MSNGETTTKRTLLLRWVGVCYLAWTLSKVGAEEGISDHNRLPPGSVDDYIESLGQVEKWEAAVQRIFAVGESDSVCDASDKSSCKCVNGNCGCCIEAKLPKIRLGGNVCVNVSYLSENIGLKLTFSFNGLVLFEREVSVHNPPPFCVGIPGIKRALSVCINLNNLRRKDRTLCGCITISFRLALIRSPTFKVGCFGIPIPIGDGEEAERRANLIVRSFAEEAQMESIWKDIDA